MSLYKPYLDLSDLYSYNFNSPSPWPSGIGILIAQLYMVRLVVYGIVFCCYVAKYAIAFGAGAEYILETHELRKGVVWI